MNAFIFHGTASHPGENWFPWLKDELERLGCSVTVPQFPTPQDQTLEAWFQVFDKHAQAYTPDTLLIGHSLGGVFALRVLERYDARIAGAYFVGAPIGIPPIKNWEGDQTFIGHPFDWERIKSHARHLRVFHSDNDPYVGLENGKALAKHLGIDLSFVPSAGHFNAAAGYTRFDLLLKAIREDQGL